MNCFSGYISSLPGVQCDRWVINVNLTLFLISLKTRFHLTKCGGSAIQGDQFFLSHIPSEDDVMYFFKTKYTVMFLFHGRLVLINFQCCWGRNLLGLVSITGCIAPKWPRCTFWRCSPSPLTSAWPVWPLMSLILSMCMMAMKFTQLESLASLQTIARDHLCSCLRSWTLTAMLCDGSFIQVTSGMMIPGLVLEAFHVSSQSTSTLVHSRYMNCILTPHSALWHFHPFQHATMQRKRSGKCAKDGSEGMECSRTPILIMWSSWIFLQELLDMKQLYRESITNLWTNGWFTQVRRPRPTQ